MAKTPECPDGRSAFRIEFQFPLSEEQKKLPTSPQAKPTATLDEKNQILGIQYELDRTMKRMR